MRKELRILMLEDSIADAELIRHVLKEAEINCITKIVETKRDFENALKIFLPEVV